MSGISRIVKFTSLPSVGFLEDPTGLQLLGLLPRLSVEGTSKTPRKAAFGGLTMQIEEIIKK